MNPLLILASHSILDASKGVDFGQFIQAILSVVCLFIDSIVYYIVSIAFKLFLAISQFQIFSDTAFNDLINRTYVVIGVISLFLVAYALINAIISQDNASKGDKSASKIVKNIIVAIVGIAIVPTVFNWFYEFQSAVLCNNTIPKLLLNSVDSDGSTVENTATQFAAYLFEAFFYPNATSSVDGDATDLSTALEDVKLNIEDPIPAADRNYDVTEYTLKVAYQHAEEGKPFFRVFSPFILGNWFDNSIVDNTVQYLVILSTVAGGYCAYVLISLCIDMGLRAVKLGYLELIAPLAIMTKVVPGKDSVFKTWVKKTVSCALEVFVRLFVVVFVIYLINTIKDIELVSLGSKICGLKLGWFLVGILRALIYCSLFAFIKKAPKFFSEATGIKTDGFKIGLMDKMKENGMIQGLGAAGSFATTAIRGGVSGFKTGGFGGIIPGTVKSVPQAFKAGQKGWKKTSDVKKWSDVKNGINTAATEAQIEHNEWEDYKKNHGGTFKNAMINKGKDTFKDAKDYFIPHQANYEYEQQKYNSIDKISKAESAINEKVKAMMEDKKEDLIDSSTGKTLGVIRREEEESNQAVNAAIQALTEAKLSGDADKIKAANNVLETAKVDRDNARKATKTAERNIKSDIRSNRQSEIFDPKDLRTLDGLYTAYQTSVADNLASLADNEEAYNKAKELSRLGHDAFRVKVEEVVRTENVVDINGQIVKDSAGNDKTRNVKFIDDVKVAAAEANNKMNQESEAARKQQEKK